MLRKFFLMLAAGLLLGALFSLTSCNDGRDVIYQCPYDCCTCDQEPGGHGPGPKEPEEEADGGY